MMEKLLSLLHNKTKNTMKIHGDNTQTTKSTTTLLDKHKTLEQRKRPKHTSNGFNDNTAIKIEEGRTTNTRMDGGSH